MVARVPVVPLVEAPAVAPPAFGFLGCREEITAPPGHVVAHPPKVPVRPTITPAAPPESDGRQVRESRSGGR